MILFIAVIALLWNQLNNVSWSDFQKLTFYHPFGIATAFSLIFLNWWLEWLKWRLVLEKIPQKESKSTQFKAFMAGIATGFLTPNMLGNFLGRLYYFQRRYRVSITLLTLLTNFTQFFSSIFFGFVALLIFLELPFHANFDVVVLVISLVLLFAILGYFFIESIPFLNRIRLVTKLKLLVKGNRIFRFKILLISMARHFVFSIQFFLILYTFIENIEISHLFGIWQVYLWSTLLPSLWLGKLLIRESMAILVLSYMGVGYVEIIVTSLLLWQFNLALPAIISVFLCKKRSNE